MISLKKEKFDSNLKKESKTKHIIARIVMICIGVFIASYILTFAYMIFWTLNNTLKGD